MAKNMSQSSLPLDLSDSDLDSSDINIENLDKKKDENKSLSCYMKGRNSISPASKRRVGFIRQHQQEAYFSHVKFMSLNNSPELRLTSSFLGKFK